MLPFRHSLPQDATALNGTQLSVGVTKLRNGSTDLFFVIPTELTQVRVHCAVRAGCHCSSD